MQLRNIIHTHIRNLTDTNDYTTIASKCTSVYVTVWHYLDTYTRTLIFLLDSLNFMNFIFSTFVLTRSLVFTNSYRTRCSTRSYVVQSAHNLKGYVSNFEF